MQIAVSSLFNLTFKSLRTFSLNLAPFILGKSFDYEMNHSVVNCSYVSESHSKHDASEETTLLQGREKRMVKLVKKDPGKARQNR